MRKPTRATLAAIGLGAALLATACTPRPAPAPAPAPVPAECVQARHLVEWAWLDLEDLWRNSQHPADDATFGAYAHDRVRLLHDQFMVAAAACPAMR